MPRNIAGRVAPTKAELLELIRRLDARAANPRRRGVTLCEFQRETGLSQKVVDRAFGGWGNAREAAGLPRRGGRTGGIPDRAIYMALHRLVTRFGRFPTVAEFNRLSPYSGDVFHSRGGKKAVQKGYARWLAIKRQLADLNARREAGETLTEQELRALYLSSTLQAPDPSRDAAAAGDGDWVEAAFARLRPAFLTHSGGARDWDAEGWGTTDYLIVLEHDWPACPKPVFPLERFLPPGGDPAQREALFGPVHDPADRRYPLKGKPPLPKPESRAR